MQNEQVPEALWLANGRLAALSWGRRDAPTWLALHGWLDNAASFSRLAPLLVEALDVRIVALDLRGHGHSAAHLAGHQGDAHQDAPHQDDLHQDDSHQDDSHQDHALWDYCHDVLDAMDDLAIAETTLLAHSMGAAVSCLLAAALPERVEQLVLIDGLGALTTPPGDTAAQLRKGLIAHRRPRSSPPRYVDIDTAVAARVAGGVTPIDADTARPLVARNSRVDDDGHVRLRTDGRLLKPSLVRFTLEQVLALLAEIRCPVLLIEGDSGILGERSGAQKARQAVARLTRRVLVGGHHLHLEAQAVEAVAKTIVRHATTVLGRQHQEESHGR